MENFSYCSPTQFVFGRDAETQVGENLKALGAKKVLIHYGKGSVVESGLLDRIIASLDASSVAHLSLGGVRPNPEVTLVREAIDLVRNEGIDFILAVGGGSVIDSAKAIAAGAPFGGDVWELYSAAGRGEVTLPEGAVPLGCVLTIPAAGSEASAFTVISNDELGLKSSMSSRYLRPQVAFMNPELTCTLPPYQSAAGATDMFAHLLERFFSESGSVPVTDNMIISLMRTIRTCAPRILEDPHDYEARANIMWAGMLAHCGIAGCGRIEDWSTHGLEHELSAHDVRVTHGAGLAVMFPAWMRFVYQENPARFVLYGREVFGLMPTDDMLADARRAIEATEQFFTSLGMPRTLAELEIREDDIEGMLPTLIQNKGELFGSFKKLTRDDAREIYRLAL
ncbi:MAG: iron-containing alcohol dehydrogenase [Raoultibacter sp.]